MDTLISTSDGDLRRAITYLQSAARLASAGEIKTEITSREIQEIAGVVPDAVVREFATALGIDSDGPADEMDLDEDSTAAVRASLLKGKKVKGFDGVKLQVKAVMRKGYSVAQLLSQVSLGQSRSSIL